ncbi:hypothetical protein M413DRAFT_286141 [Hebeloma cylindrosporum]|uniref:Uncharacterized protein n=1 Tax=Hebeloma cylindrosporum TaxID=76867 RepID=A0A0C3BX85_HEBCY|nr:hypothetical protein M413DRAFT_286141 [Hebeloma cylindrosporum h7]
MVLLAKNERLTVEYAQRVEARREEVADFYDDTKVYIDAAHWQHLPKIRDIQQLAPLVDYIRSDPKSIGESCFPIDAGRSATLGFVDQWIKETQAHLCEILKSARHAATQASQCEPTEVLNLATAVFLCRSRCPPSIGWDSVGPHLLCAESQVDGTRRRPTREKGFFQFFEDGYNTVIQLLGLLDLDPLVTTTKDLDKLEARFICQIPESPVVKAAAVMTWRQCVNHVAHVRTIMHNPPALRLSVLTEEATQTVLHHEQLYPYPYPGDPVWSCRRCTEHLKNPTTRQGVVSHLKLVSVPPLFSSLQSGPAFTDMTYRHAPLKTLTSSIFNPNCHLNANVSLLH